MSGDLNRRLYFAGTMLAIIGVAFVLMRLWSYASEVDLSRINWEICSLIAALSLAYGATNLMLAFSWRNLLQYFGFPVTLLWSIRVYGLSQIGKYVPGNVFHFAGRQALGAAAGLPHFPLAKSSIWELGLMVLSGCLFGLIALPLRIESIPISISFGLFFCTSIIFTSILMWVFGYLIAKAFLRYLLFLFLSGLIFVGLVELISKTVDNGGMIWLPWIGAYVLAWLAGVVTPGAPAGFGVREVVLIFMLQGALGQVEILLAVTIGRLVTAGGDLLYFLMATRLPRW